MSKQRGCIFFTHVDCDYNRCRGREISAGHVADCPFLESDTESQCDEARYSDDEGEDDRGWEPVPTAESTQSESKLISHTVQAAHTRPTPIAKAPTPQAQRPKTHRFKINTAIATLNANSNPQTIPSANMNQLPIYPRCNNTMQVAYWTIPPPHIKPQYNNPTHL